MKPSVNGFLNVLLVTLAYMLAWSVSDLSVDVYYKAFSIVCSLICIISTLLYMIISSKLILLYASVNFLTSIVYFAIHLGAYKYLNYLLWYAPLNLSLIAEAIELMLLSNGVFAIVVVIFNSSIANTYKCKGTYNCMAKTK